MAEPNGRKFPDFEPVQGPDEFGDKPQTFQAINYPILRRAPGIKDLGEGQIKLAVVGGVKRLYARLDGQIVSTILT